ncbi:MAG: phoP [Clostridiales bacterium]|jgi:two-component system alkaline phosphatase synthesis response regulator PhoP|nr:phoP [Clostridiales bacterium]
MDQPIFVVEDDENIREVLKCTITSFSYQVQAFECAEEMLIKIEEVIPKLILLDIMLPGIDGMETLKRLKSNKNYVDIPVIILTAKGNETDKVKGLDLGADDYIAKPFGILEIGARIRAVLRRSEGRGQKLEESIEVYDLQIDLNKHAVYKNGNQIELTLKEYDLLKILVNNRQRVVPREELLNIVWGIDFIGETRTLDVHIKSLRSKLGLTAESTQYIKTVRGVGYTFSIE